MKKSNSLTVILVITFSILAISCNSSTYDSGDNDDTSIELPINSSNPQSLCPVKVTIERSITACYEAPQDMRVGKFYRTIDIFSDGEVLQVIGVNSDKSWLVVLTPKSEQQCWIEDYGIETEDETSCLPIITPDPDVTPIAPPPRHGQPPP